jgi:hypothetical protein
MEVEVVERSLRGSDSAGAVIRSDPDRVLRALIAADATTHDVLWRRLLWRLADPDWMKAATAETKADVLRMIPRFSADNLVETALPTTNWLKGVVTGEGDEVLLFLVGVNGE